MQRTQLKLLGWDMPITEGEVMRVFEQDTWYTRLAVAKALGRTKSPTLIAMLHLLWQKGWLEVNTMMLPNQVEMYLYRITAEGDSMRRYLYQHQAPESEGGNEGA